MSQKQNIVRATGGALGLSALALAFGVCCVAPWAVTLLGVGGAVLLARLAFIQPYVVAVTLLLIGFGIWYAYRRQSATAVEGCPVENRKALRWIVWIGALVVIAIDVASFVPLFLS